MRTLTLSIISTIITLLVWLWWNDNGIVTGKEETLMKWESLLSIYLGTDFSQIPDDYLFINTNNDLQLVEVSEDIDGIPFHIGNASITDREKLARLLQLLSANPVHKYVFLDILLEKQYQTSSDSVLVSAINSTPRLVCAVHDTSLLDGISSDKTGRVSYRSTLINSDFCKYDLIADTEPSITYKAYHELFPDEASPSTLSFMPMLFFNKKQKYADGIQSSDYYSYESEILNLGAEVLNPYADFKKLVEDKYIFIGNFENNYDMHSTYLDRMDGIQIHANTFANLLKRNHIRHPLVTTTMAVTIFIFYIMLFSKNRREGISTGLSAVDASIVIAKKKFLDRKSVKFILSFLTIEIIFTILFYLFVFSTERIVEVSSLSILFTVLWNLPSNRVYSFIRNKIPLLMNKARRLRASSPATLLMTLLVCLSSHAYGESFKILYISSPNSIICDNNRKIAGDTISTHSRVKWTNQKQAMRVQSLSNGSYRVIQNRPSVHSKNMTIGDYLKSSPIMAGRGDSHMNHESLRAAIPDTLLLLDKIEIPTSVRQNDSQFFFIEYRLDGETIQKKLPVSERTLIIDRSIYTIDGKAINPFITPVNIFYYDKPAASIKIIGENKVVVPLDL